MNNLDAPAQLAAVFEAAARLDVRVHAGRVSPRSVSLELEPGAPVEALASLIAAAGLEVTVAPGQHLVKDLSPRERELVGHLTAGLRLKEVAQQMGVQTHTAREYWLRVKRKWDVKSIAQAVSIWTEHRHAHGERGQ